MKFAEVISADDHEPTQSLRSILQQAVDEITNPDSEQSSCRYGINFSKFPLWSKPLEYDI